MKTKKIPVLGVKKRAFFSFSLKEGSTLYIFSHYEELSSGKLKFYYSSTKRFATYSKVVSRGYKLNIIDLGIYYGKI